MVKRIILLSIILFLCGCAAVDTCSKNKFSPVKAYMFSTQASKNKLDSDLRSGKIGIGDELDSIRSNYGDPDNIFTSKCIVRINYIIDPNKSIILWFEDGKHLSMWKD